MNIETIRSLVRPFLVVSLVAMAGYAVYMGQIEGNDIWNMVGIIMAFYFSERSMLKGIEKMKGDKEDAEV